MKKRRGFLRRAAILVAFAWASSHFLGENSPFMWSEEVRAGLRWLLYAAVAWGLVTLWADRAPETPKTTEDEHHEDTNNGSHGSPRP